MDQRRVAVCLAGAAAFVPLYAPQSLLPLLKSWAGDSAALLGGVVSAGTAGVAVAAPFAGRLADRIGRRRTIVAAAWLAAIPSLLSALAPTPLLLLIARFLEGLTLPGIFAVTVAYTADEWPPEQARPITALYVAGTIGGGFCGRMLSGLVAEFAGWRWGFAALAVLQLLLAYLIYRWLSTETRSVRRQAQARVPFRQLLADPALRSICVAGFTLLFALVAGFTYLSLRLSEPPYSLSPARLSAIFVVYLVSVVVTPLGGRLLNRHGHAAILSGAWLFSISGLAITLIPTVPMAMLGLCVFSLGLFVAQTAATTFVGEAMPQARGAAVGLYVTCYYIGGSCGGVLPAPAWHWLGWPGVALTIAVAGLCSIYVARRAFALRAAANAV